jgi:hypothetical protein
VGCWTWFFDGEIVVRCVVIVVKKMVLFLRRKTRHILEVYFRVGPEVPATLSISLEILKRGCPGVANVVVALSAERKVTGIVLASE